MSLHVTALTKSFGGATALAGVDLTVRPGQVHALLGHNGAGKSTLIGCLGGAFPPDSGVIEVAGARHERLTPRQSLAAGISIIYQSLGLVDALSVSDNVFLGRERRWLVDRAGQRAVAAELLARVGASCAPGDRVADLPTGQRQLVAIAKALGRDASVLVLDEPTAALSGAETELLLRRVRDLRDQGLAIVYVTHLLGEVHRVADEVTVLRDGRVGFRARVAEVGRADLVTAIAGPGQPTAPRSAAPAGDAPPGLALEGLAGPGMGPVDLRVAPGELVGLFGLIGSGRTRLLETVFGARAGTAGVVRVAGRVVTPTSPARAIAAGIALVPGDRRRQGLFASLSTADNVLLPAVPGLARFGWRRRGAERARFQRTARAVGLRPARPALPVAGLSGGNQQKVLIGRWLGGARTRVLLLDEPTQGVDVGARREIYRVVTGLAREGGTAVLFASADPEEVLALADRCLVVAAGRVVAELSGAALSESALLAAAHGTGGDR